MTPLPPLTYLSMDSVSEGIGLSQVTRYVERLARRGVDVTLHSFEKDAPGPEMTARLSDAGVRWRPHRFGTPGSAGGLARVAYGAAVVAGADLVHARSDMAAASALLSRRRAWVWDVRAFWREQRIDTGILRAGSPPERVMRAVEGAAARSCTGIVTLTHAAVDTLAERYGDGVAAKSRVITTCVDLDLFAPSPFPTAAPVRLLLAGTLNSLYDVSTMLRFVDHLRRRRPAELTVLTPQPTHWDGELQDAGFPPRHALPSEMPGQVGRHHVGLSVLRRDMGLSSRAVMPTKVAEFLASGRPVVVNAGLGDMQELLGDHDCGVVIHDATPDGIGRAVGELERLLDDERTPGRCRALAEKHFDIERGVEELLDLYRQAVA